MIVSIAGSIHRPWLDQGGFYACAHFPSTIFTELSPTVEVRQVRDSRGRWRSVRGVHERLGRAVLETAHAVRCRDPHGLEGILIYGGELGVLMIGVGEPGAGSPILWVEDVRDVPRNVAHVLQSEIGETEA
jgi:hypothetical protein